MSGLYWRTDAFMPKHKTVLLEHGRWRESIDKNIASLILETWKAGVSTDYSCEDEREPGDKDAWVVLGFPSVTAARRWMRIVAGHKKDLRWLHNQEMRVTCREMQRRGVACWRWETYAYDAVYGATGPTRLDFGVLVRFPASDLVTVMRRLRARQRRRRSSASSRRM